MNIFIVEIFIFLVPSLFFLDELKQFYQTIFDFTSSFCYYDLLILKSVRQRRCLVFRIYLVNIIIYNYFKPHICIYASEEMLNECADIMHYCYSTTTICTVPFLHDYYIHESLYVY